MVAIGIASEGVVLRLLRMLRKVKGGAWTVDGWP